MAKMKMEEREEICLKILKKFPLEHYILIGGYAVSSFEFPRFSVDLDVVIPEKEENSFLRIIQKEKFKQVELKVEPPQDIYGGRFQRLEKEINGLKVGVDLLINSVISRQTQVSYSFEYLFKNSEIREVSSFSKPIKVRARVANREMLIALKINSMRLADKRDLVVLCHGDIKVEEVVDHLKRCPKEVMLKNLDSLLNDLKQEKFRDSLKGVFMLSNDVYERLIDQSIEVFGQIREKLQ